MRRAEGLLSRDIVHDAGVKTLLQCVAKADELTATEQESKAKRGRRVGRPGEGEGARGDLCPRAPLARSGLD